jgi:hypothetical protein
LSAVPGVEGCLTRKLQTAGWAKYSHEQYGLQSWGASGPYKKVYEKFGITGDSTFPFRFRIVTCPNLTIPQTLPSLERK